MDLSKIKLSEVYEGWRNKLIPPEELKETIESVSAARIKVCEDCSYHSKNFQSIRLDAHCTQCGCTLSAKTKCLSCKCPLPTPLWGPLEINLKEPENEKK